MNIEKWVCILATAVIGAIVIIESMRHAVGFHKAMSEFRKLHRELVNKIKRQKKRRRNK